MYLKAITIRNLGHLPKSDEIHECGEPALLVLKEDPVMCVKFAYQKLHDVPYKDVQTCWRRLYVDAALAKSLKILEDKGLEGKKPLEGGKDNLDWITEIVKELDMALILTGAPRRGELIERWFSALSAVLTDSRWERRITQEEKGNASNVEIEIDSKRARKRRKLGEGLETEIPETFPTTITRQPSLRFPIPRVQNISLEAFQSRISDPETQAPFIIEGAIDFWPALSERPWNRPSYLLSHTLDGRRLVPVEIGRAYTDQSWGQKILSFGEFMRDHMFHNGDEVEAEDEGSEEDDKGSQSQKPKRKTGYLAQHDLLSQIPSLRADIAIPDYCYADPPPLSPSTNLSNVKPVPKLDTPLLNAWFGPANTVSPLHTDPYHNILAQVVGYKYIRLYAPSETEALHPMGIDDKGIDMNNTSSVDLDAAMKLFPEISPWSSHEHEEEREKDDAGADAERRAARWSFEQEFPGFKDAEYLDCVLGPGDCLYIPVGWWHYVRSLTPSFSVSFWFN